MGAVFELPEELRVQPIYKGAKRLLWREAPVVIEAAVAVLSIIAPTISCKLLLVII